MPPFPPDQLDTAKVTTEGSQIEVLQWPVTAILRECWIRPGTLHVRVDKTTSWPPVSIEGKSSPDDDQEATFWIFVPTNSGGWLGTGADRLRPGQVNQDDKPTSDNIKTLFRNWFYNPQIWPRLNGYMPVDGEIVGAMVAAGQSRAGLEAPVRERTSIVLLQYHEGTDSYDPYQAQAPGQEQPPDSTQETPASPGTDTGTQVILDLVLGAIQATEGRILAGQAAMEERFKVELERQTDRVITKASQVGAQLAAGMQAPALRDLLGGLFGGLGHPAATSSSAPDPQVADQGTTQRKSSVAPASQTQAQTHTPASRTKSKK